MPTIIVSQNQDVSFDAALTSAASILKTKSTKHPDLKIITDKRALGIDAVKALIHYLSRKPYQAESIVAIIHPGETLTLEAQNALLKTLEEPPEFAHLFITTTHLSHLLPTVRSRCYIKTLQSRAKIQNTPIAVANLIAQPVSIRLKTIESLLKDKTVTSKTVIIWVDQWILETRGKDPKLIRLLILIKKYLHANVSPLHALDQLALHLFDQPMDFAKQAKDCQ